MKENNSIENNPKIKKIAVAILFGVPILLAVLINMRDKARDKEIDNNIGKVKGVITGVRYGRSPDITWKYKVEGIIYEGYALDTKQFNFVKRCPDRSCVGDSVEIEYSTKNPERSRLVFHGMRSYR